MRLALVTGGCRRLGAAIAAALAEAGYALALHASRDATPEPGFAATLQRLDTRWHGFPADLFDPEAVEALLPAVIAHFGRAPDLLVNSASQFDADRLDNVEMANMAHHHAVNCAAPARLIRAFASAGTGGGRSIVNILDQRIAYPHADQLSYTLSKMGLAALTRIVARDLPVGMRINAVAPGLTLPTADYAPDQLDGLAQSMPLGLLPDPADVAEAVLYLSRAGQVNGQFLYVDGGAHLRPYGRDFVHLGGAPAEEAATIRADQRL